MNGNREEEQNVQHEQQQSFHLSDYEEAGSEEIIVEFARNSYPLVGAIIDGNMIRGDFGYGEVQKPRNERLVKFQNNRLTLVEQVSKIIVTKSTIKKKENLQVKEKEDQVVNQENLKSELYPNNDLNKQPEEVVEEEERFFSESSKSSDEQQREQRQTKNMIKKKSLIKKQINQRDSSKLNKNILKKKLKYLSSK